MKLILMIVISYFAFLKGVTTASKYAPSFVTGYRVYTYLFSTAKRRSTKFLLSCVEGKTNGGWVFIERIQWQGQINKIHTKKKPDSGQSGRRGPGRAGRYGYKGKRKPKRCLAGV